MFPNGGPCCRGAELRQVSAAPNLPYSHPTPTHSGVLTSPYRFKVEHRGRIKDQHTAWACIRLDRLQSGYRFIKLKDADGYDSNGELLVKIEKNVYHEPPRSTSLRAKTWSVCKRGGEEVSRLGSRWSCQL